MFNKRSEIKLEKKPESLEIKLVENHEQTTSLSVLVQFTLKEIHDVILNTPDINAAAEVLSRIAWQRMLIEICLSTPLTLDVLSELERLNKILPQTLDINLFMRYGTNYLAMKQISAENAVELYHSNYIEIVKGARKNITMDEIHQFLKLPAWPTKAPKIPIYQIKIESLDDNQSTRAIQLSNLLSHVKQEPISSPPTPLVNEEEMNWEQTSYYRGLYQNSVLFSESSNSPTPEQQANDASHDQEIEYYFNFNKYYS